MKLSAIVAAGPAFACSDDQGPREDRVLFPQSVASGDPRPESVVLWTRAWDVSAPTADVIVRLDVSPRADFSSLVLQASGIRAQALADHTVKVKVTNLSPATTYHFRFVALLPDGTERRSPVGRTRTAPAPTADTPIKIAFASCQDYVGRHYNSWQLLLAREEDLDAVLFLGDYIYETTADPGFMTPGGPARTISFSDVTGALPVGGPGSPNLAARSLDNYRQLYRIYRSDPQLQAVHERFPFIAVWDDHEHSNDAWGAHATYTSGATEELDLERRRNAERAFFEYLPIDPPGAPPGPPPGAPGPAAEALNPADAPLYPATRIWRDFVFGAHAQLAALDLRTYRPDHLVPEEAYPGTVFLDAAGLGQLAATGALPAEGLAAFGGETFAYVDITDPGLALLRSRLVAEAAAEAQAAGIPPDVAQTKAAAAVSGNLAIVYVNQVIQRLNAQAAAGTPLLVPLSPENQPRGLAFVHLGKAGFFTSIGSRYILAADSFEVYAAALYARSGAASEDLLGPAQEQWLSALLDSASGTRWTLIGSSVSMTRMLLDLRMVPVLPESQRLRLLFSADQWDGFPNRKRHWLGRMAASNGGRAVSLAGDIHAAFASLERASADGPGVPCLTAPAISSATSSEVARAAVAGVGLDPNDPAVGLLVASLDGLFQQANPGILLSDGKHHGVVVIEVNANEILARYHLVPATEVGTSYAGRTSALLEKAITRTVRITPGAMTLIG